MPTELKDEGKKATQLEGEGTAKGGARATGDTRTSATLRGALKLIVRISFVYNM